MGPAPGTGPESWIMGPDPNPGLINHAETAGMHLHGPNLTIHEQLACIWVGPILQYTNCWHANAWAQPYNTRTAGMHLGRPDPTKQSSTASKPQSRKQSRKQSSKQTQGLLPPSDYPKPVPFAVKTLCCISRITMMLLMLY